MICIIGSGLTGLSVGFHLRKRPYLIFEKEEKPGGLCRSIKTDGFTFDYTGHLLHVKNPYTHRLLSSIAPGKFVKIIRKAAIYYKGRYVAYPFQANTFGLPKEVVFDCVMGFVDAYMKKSSRKTGLNFKDWAVSTFGEGIARHFFIPYNEKLWQTDLRELTNDWASWSIPRPTLQEVIQGSIGIQNRGMGYNASFYYPEKSGIEILPHAMSRKVGNIQYGKILASVSLSKKCIKFKDGHEAQYDTLVSTIPLPRLLKLIEDLPSSYKRAVSRLRYVSVHNLNIGINRENVSDFHWIYFPEPEFPFYRVGIYSNFSKFLAPEKTSSMYIEVSSSPGSMKDPETVTKTSIEALKKCGILKKRDRILVKDYNTIEYAYVIFDKFHKKMLLEIIKFLQKKHIISAGRYGGWTYSSMEDSIIQGRQIARALK